MERITVTLVTDSSGDATGFTKVIRGLIHSIQYVKTDYTDGVDFTITGEVTTQQVWVESNVNAAKTVAPSIPTHDEIGVASLYAGAGEPVERPIAIVEERLKIVIAAGGATKTGAFHVIVDGSVQGKGQDAT